VLKRVIEFLSSIDLTIIKLIGMVISGAAGLVVSWISKRSVNYRKIDKSIVISSLLFFVYINGLSAVLGAVLGIAFVVIIDILAVESMMLLMLLSLIIAAINIWIFWGFVIKTKRMKTLMTRAKEESRALHLLINLISAISVVLGFIYAPLYIDTQSLGVGERPLFISIMDYTSWIITIWWFGLMISLVWRTAKYVFSEMVITLVDGEIINYSCAPQMCRVHKNYLRLIKRDENDVIIYERHINESSIKQIEYISDNKFTDEDEQKNN
jgi:hypothetical protein